VQAGLPYGAMARGNMAIYYTEIFLTALCNFANRFCVDSDNTFLDSRVH